MFIAGCGKSWRFVTREVMCRRLTLGVVAKPQLRGIGRNVNTPRDISR